MVKQTKTLAAYLLGTVAALSILTTATVAVMAKATAEQMAKVTTFAEMAKTVDELQTPEHQLQLQQAFQRKLEELDSSIAGMKTSEQKKLATEFRGHVQKQLDGLKAHFKAHFANGSERAPAGVGGQRAEA